MSTENCSSSTSSNNNNSEQQILSLTKTQAPQQSSISNIISTTTMSIAATAAGATTTTTTTIRKAFNDKVIIKTIDQQQQPQQQQQQQQLQANKIVELVVQKFEESVDTTKMIDSVGDCSRTVLVDTKALNRQKELDERYGGSNGREARNRAEKNRRDKLNKSIQELAGMVRNVAGSSRRVDKTGILRFSAHGLRIDYVFNSTSDPCQFSINHSTTDALLNLINGFLITVTCRGNIVIASSSIEQHLGHCQTDLLGQNLLNYTHPDDQAFLKQQLIPKNLDKLFDSTQPEDENGEPRPRTDEEEREIDRKLKEDKRYFTIRIARAGPRSEPTAYETVSFDGSFRRADSAPRGIRSSNYPTGLQMLRRPRCGRDESIPLHSIGGNDIVLIVMGHIVKPPVIYDRLFEASKFEYKTRHLIDGRIVQCDQRISLVAGYMADEVFNLSPFTFMHRDDVRWVMVALRQMYDFSSPYGESCYRLMARTGQFIYLRTRGYLDIDRDTNQVRSFVCVNALVDEEEGKQLVTDMKKKFAIMIQETEFSSNEADVPAVENPAQLERAIISLITNLHHGSLSADEMIASPETQGSIDGHESDTNRSVKSPPLEIIAPKTSSIKTSIARSVDVVSTAVKGIYDSSDNESEHSDGSTLKTYSRPTVVQRNLSTKSTGELTINDTKSKIMSPTTSTMTNQMQHQSPQRKQKPIVEQSAAEMVTIKQEQPDAYVESRVPPLPTNAGYFDMNPFEAQQYIESVSSPLESKPFDFLRFDPMSSQQTEQTGYLSPQISPQYQPYDTGDINSSTSPSYTDTSNQIPMGGVKRARTTDDADSKNKKRFFSGGSSRTEVSNPATDTAYAEYETKPSLLLHQTCIDQLTDPNSDLEKTLSSTFNTLDQSLRSIHETASELRDQGTTYSNQQLNEILEAGKEQSQMLDNLRQRYEICLQAAPEQLNDPLLDIDECDLYKTA